ncbi:unnamed protein product [Anisakis simplex]|uniref:Conserved secreted protein n=1 Tax=Anisakis simplex TaxID=6269 RepID=A0A0M3K134_ANISI|nr:unnamed protein product [Anisakis simplex]
METVTHLIVILSIVLLRSSAENVTLAIETDPNSLETLTETEEVNDETIKETISEDENDSDESFEVPPPLFEFENTKFADEYLTKKQQHEMKQLVREARSSGADLDEVRRVVLRYINSVLTKQQKKQITANSEQLKREFSDDSLINA